MREVMLSGSRVEKVPSHRARGAPGFDERARRAHRAALARAADAWRDPRAGDAHAPARVDRGGHDPPGGDGRSRGAAGGPRRSRPGEPGAAIQRSSCVASFTRSMPPGRRASNPQPACRPRPPPPPPPPPVTSRTASRASRRRWLLCARPSGGSSDHHHDPEDHYERVRRGARQGIPLLRPPTRDSNLVSPPEGRYHQVTHEEMRSV